MLAEPARQGGNDGPSGCSVIRHFDTCGFMSGKLCTRFSRKPQRDTISDKNAASHRWWGLESNFQVGSTAGRL